ncbi:hypothetical protein GF407_04575 [candidate division KSB1 bacterium]|nr:hypothetical protein [candidate division KSB1 bacterium]
MLEFRYSGFSIAHSAAANREVNLEQLSLADSAGIRLLLSDSRINRVVENQKDTTLALLDSVIQDYGSRPGLWGYYISSNPEYDQFTHLAKIVNHFGKKDPAHHAFISIHPLYKNPKSWGVSDYSDYIQAFVDTVQPSILSVSPYPVIEFKLHPDYFKNLEIMRDIWIENNIPFWPTVMVAHVEDLPPTVHSHLRLQSFSALAYGARGIQYFSYFTPKDRSLNYKNALIDAEGNRSSIYQTVMRINREIKQIGQILNQCKSIRVYHTEPLPAGTQRLESRDPILFIKEGQFLVGLFEDMDKKRYALLVNRDYLYGAKITVYFDNSVNMIREIAKNHVKPYIHTWTGAGERSCELLFKAGDGRLFEITE